MLSLPEAPRLVVPGAVPQAAWTEDDFDLIEEYYAAEARESLWAFRQYVDPKFRTGWFPYDLSCHLQEFFAALMRGERPVLIIEAPPQHGKSRGLHDFIAWVAGKAPDIRTLYASFSDDLGVSANMYLQRLYDDRTKFGRVFPKTFLSSTNVVTAVAGAGRYLRNSKFLEYVGYRGHFRNTTVQGQINGKGFDLGIIDDPIKGRAAAQSKAIRDKTWEWMTDDFLTRFSDDAGMIILATRWHVDDPTGRYLAKTPEAKVLKYPAEYVVPKKVRLEDGTMVDARNDVIDPRSVGDVLFPEFKSRSFIMDRKRKLTQASWESLYQQSPIIAGGGMFPIDRIRYARNLPSASDIKKSVRYWDKAGTENGGAGTAGTLMHALVDGRWFISDVRNGHWSSWDRERMIRATAEMDDAQWGRIETWIEQEPGSGGKESAERTIANLAGFKIQADKVTGSKELRAEPYAAQWQAGNIILHANQKWNGLFMDQHETFPQGLIDVVDASAGAFMKTLVRKYNYDSSLGWVA